MQPLFLLLRTRKMLEYSFYLVIFGIIGVCGGYHEQKFAMEPQDQVCNFYLLAID